MVEVNWSSWEYYCCSILGWSRMKGWVLGGKMEQNMKASEEENSPRQQKTSDCKENYIYAIKWSITMAQIVRLDIFVRLVQLCHGSSFWRNYKAVKF